MSYIPCPQCGGTLAHFPSCGLFAPPLGLRYDPLPLTEERLRQIIREELDRRPSPAGSEP
jgi:hypothetical protein